MVDEPGKAGSEDREDYSALPQVEPVEWSEDELQDYQAAIDQIHDIISRLSSLEWGERRKPDADLRLVAAIKSRKNYFADARDNLRIADHEAVLKIRTECSRIRVSGDFGIDQGAAAPALDRHAGK